MLPGETRAFNARVLTENIRCVCAGGKLSPESCCKEVLDLWCCFTCFWVFLQLKVLYAFFKVILQYSFTNFARTRSAISLAIGQRL